MTKTDPKRLAYLREYMKRPDVAARRRAYRERTKEARYTRNHEYMRTYNATDKKREANRRFMSKYSQRPEVAERNRERLWKYRQIHGEQLRLRDRERYNEHKETYYENNARRRARKNNAQGKHTQAQWFARVAFHEWKCFYCRIVLTSKILTKDHATPLVLGGADWPSNLVPACARCNASKRHTPWKLFRKYRARRDAIS